MTKLDRGVPVEASHMRIGEYLVKVYPTYYNDPSKLPLSMRELDVLYWFSAGLRGPAVAKKIGVSPHTVDTYKRRVFEKLGVGTIAQASALAMAIATGADVTKNS